MQSTLDKKTTLNYTLQTRAGSDLVLSRTESLSVCWILHLGVTPCSQILGTKHPEAERGSLRLLSGFLKEVWRGKMKRNSGTAFEHNYFQPI